MHSFLLVFQLAQRYLQHLHFSCGEGICVQNPPFFLLRHPRQIFGHVCSNSPLLRAVSCGQSFGRCSLFDFCFATHQEPVNLTLGLSVRCFPQPSCLEFVWSLPCPVSCPFGPLSPPCLCFPSLVLGGGSINESSTTMDLIVVMAVFGFGLPMFVYGSGH